MLLKKCTFIQQYLVTKKKIAFLCKMMGIKRRVNETKMCFEKNFMTKYATQYCCIKI